VSPFADVCSHYISRQPAASQRSGAPAVTGRMAGAAAASPVTLRA
jgi:hypothetical protein